MRLNGRVTVPADPKTTYELLTDPEVLTQAMPGLKSLAPIDSGPGAVNYSADMEVGVAAIKGKYNGTMSVIDPEPGVGYRLAVSGQGPGGFVEISLQIHLTGAANGTDVGYDGEAKVGGTIAGVGQRMMSGVASLLLKQFFQGIGKVAKERA